MSIIKSSITGQELADLCDRLAEHDSRYEDLANIAAEIGFTGRPSVLKMWMSTGGIDRKYYNTLLALLDSGEQTAQVGNEQPSVLQDGKSYLVSFDGERVRLPDLVGLRYILILMKNAGTHFSGTELVRLDSSADQRDLINAQGQMGHDEVVVTKDQVRVITEKLEDLYLRREASSDVEELDQLEDEIEKLEDYLTSSTYDGKSKSFDKTFKNRQENVKRAINRALQSTGKVHPSFYEYLAKFLSCEPQGGKHNQHCFKDQDTPWKFN